MDHEKVFVLMESDEFDEVGSVVAAFTGPEAEERAMEVKRLKDMFREATNGPQDVHLHIRKLISNPSNSQLGLAPALPEVSSNEFVQAAIASIFTYGAATVPAWLNVEWLRFEVSKMTNEDIKADGQILRLNPPQRWGHGGIVVDETGFVESDR